MPDGWVHARVGGRRDKPALVLLHGFPQSHVMWHRVAQRLRDDYFLVLPDLRGYGDARYSLRTKLGGWGADGTGRIEPEALTEYERCFCRAEAIHSACEDYRASAGIDLEHDRESRLRGDRIACDTLVPWGEKGLVARMFKPLALWQAQCAGKVTGSALPAGHFIPEEMPERTAGALRVFFG